jgi:hypothetical protein
MGTPSVPIATEVNEPLLMGRLSSVTSALPRVQETLPQ